ncbi:integrase, catalytic region, zinc finger, CCHC-type containing protein [Tanacetum coccineum]
MQGTDISMQERNSRLMNEFDKFVAEDGESLTSVYERFSTLMNVMDRNKGTPREISINTKFLNSLQPEWSKYVTLARQKYIIEKEHFDVLHDYMSQFEPHVKASKAKKAARNHDPLALVANSHAHSSYSHAREIQGNAQEDKLSTTMIKNVGYAGNGNRIAERTKRNQATNAENGLCYNCNERGHYACDCPKPRVCDAKYLREQMLLATKNEAGVHLDEEGNYFMLDNAYGDNTLEELSAAMIMMACI